MEPCWLPARAASVHRWHCWRQLWRRYAFDSNHFCKIKHKASDFNTFVYFYFVQLLGVEIPVVQPSVEMRTERLSCAVSRLSVQQTAKSNAEAIRMKIIASQACMHSFHTLTNGSRRKPVFKPASLILMLHLLKVCQSFNGFVNVRIHY
jgi:hypothetical protein